jgi:ferredoxin
MIKSMSNMKIFIDEEKCLGCEICTTICPEMFTSAEDGIVHTIFESVPDELLDLSYHAEECCPSQAIKLVSPDLWDG